MEKSFNKKPPLFYSKHKAIDKNLLEKLYQHYSTDNFIEFDPISIPHSFSKKEDIEVSAFLTASFSWGNRKMIIKNAHYLMNLLDNCPYDFCLNASLKERAKVCSFVHRTMNGDDMLFFINSIKNIILKHKSLGHWFETEYAKTNDLKKCIIMFRELFFTLEHNYRVEKHLSDILKNSAAKRMNMFLRWMIRKDEKEIDFGLWNIPASALYIPLDVHVGFAALELGLITINRNNWFTVQELTQNLRLYDAHDPIKYDFALFGLGMDLKKI